MKVKSIEEISPDIEALIRQSRQYMVDLYPSDSIHQEDSVALLDASTFFLGAYLDGDLMGIGAVKKFDTSPRYGEIKYLFVDPKYRGRRVSRQIMNALEQQLIEQEIAICRLETGVNQPESVSLYSKLGYSERAPFGDYKPDPLSIFMQKNLRSL